MKVMKRDDWPELMDGAQQSVLILAPWIDDALIEELFSFLPPVDVRIVFPRSTLKEEGSRGSRYALRGVLDTNFDAEIRVIDEEIPACLVVDGERFYYSETYADQLEGKADDSDSAIAYARGVWAQSQPWD
jgi:hypothetical protein